jgi:hypothetical protein
LTMRRSADEIVYLRRLRRRERWWWWIDGRSCPGCGKLWRRTHTAALDARPEWVECVACEQKRLNGEWTRDAEAEFIAKARAVFPGSHEPVRSIGTAPSARSRTGSQLRFDGGEAA